MVSIPDENLSYLEWNNILAKYFFNEEMAGREVILFADKETIDMIAQTYNDSYDNFIRCIKEGPPWARTTGICQMAIKAYDDWRSKKLDYPPYFIYLIFFVVAATVDGDFDVKAYYPRFRRLLGEQEITGTYPSFEKMAILWEDLEKWSIEDKHEALGRFTKRIRGKWIHIGLPLSQLIMSDRERKLLPQFFSEEGLDPADPPTFEALSKHLAIWGNKCFSHRTKKLLYTSDESLSTLRQALTEFVMNDLVEWDGVYFDPSATTEEPLAHPYKQALVGVHICLEIDELIGYVKTSLRLKANRVFPDEELTFNINGKILKCRGSGAPGWSTKLSTSNNTGKNTIFEPTMLDWSKSYSFSDNDEAWTSRFRGSKIKIFLPGEHEGLPDWVECQRIYPRSKYMICAHNDEVEGLSRWGQSSNKIFRKVPLQGLPSGWALFFAEDIMSSYPRSDSLSLPTKSIIHIQGGIRIGRTNRFLKIAPPQLLVDEGSDGIIVTVNDMRIMPQSNNNSFKLPDNLPLDSPIRIELRAIDNSVTEKRVISLTSIDTPVIPDKIVRNKFGDILDKPTKEALSNKNNIIWGVSGVITLGGDVSDSNANIITIPTYLSRRIIFIGKEIGQVIDWPRDELPREWAPVWAIAKVGRDKWQLYFCGNPLDEQLSPTKGVIANDRKAVRYWKSVVWGMRRTISPPKFKQHQLLWRLYQECASRV